MKELIEVLRELVMSVDKLRSATAEILNILRERM